jgi:hypothetical protein
MRRATDFKRWHTRHVSGWAFLLTVLLLVIAMLLGYRVLDHQAKVIHAITLKIEAKNALHDKQLCDQAHINRALTPYILPKEVRKYLHKFLVDINKDKTECHPSAPVIAPSTRP